MLLLSLLLNPVITKQQHQFHTTVTTTTEVSGNIFLNSYFSNFRVIIPIAFPFLIPATRFIPIPVEFSK